MPTLDETKAHKLHMESWLIAMEKIISMSHGEDVDDPYRQYRYAQAGNIVQDLSNKYITLLVTELQET